MSTVLTCLAILAAGCAVTALSIFLIRRFVPDELKGSEERREPVFAFAGVLYALVIGFVLAYALDGQLLSRAQGLVRLIVPSERDDALRQVKWVREVRVVGDGKRP